MAKLSQDQVTRLEQELISIFQSNPAEPYQKLRRSGKLPASRRFGSRAEGTPTQFQHPVARAYQELDEAKRSMEEAQKRYEDAQTNLRSILKQSLPQDFLETLMQDQQQP